MGTPQGRRYWVLLWICGKIFFFPHLTWKHSTHLLITQSVYYVLVLGWSPSVRGGGYSNTAPLGSIHTWRVHTFLFSFINTSLSLEWSQISIDDSVWWVDQIYRCVTMMYHNSGHYRSSCPLLTTQRCGGWILPWILLSCLRRQRLTFSIRLVWVSCTWRRKQNSVTETPRRRKNQNTHTWKWKLKKTQQEQTQIRNCII
jgi:hypothetical protein